MTDFVLEQRNKVEASTYEQSKSMMIIVAANIFNYATFLKQPLKLEMFVPCDEMTEVMNYEEIKQKLKERIEYLESLIQNHKQ